MRDARLVRHFAVLAVELGQRLDVVAGEGDRHHQHVLLPPRAEPLDDLRGAGAQPANGPHVGLVGEEVRVGAAEPLDDGLHARSDLLGIGVAAIDHVERQGTG